MKDITPNDFTVDRVLAYMSSITYAGYAGTQYTNIIAYWKSRIFTRPKLNDGCTFVGPWLILSTSTFAVP